MTEPDDRIQRIKNQLLEMAALNKGLIGCKGSNANSDFAYEIVVSCFETAAKIVEKTK